MRQYRSSILVFVMLILGIIARENTDAKPQGQSIDRSRNDNDERREIFLETKKGRWFEYETENSYWYGNAQTALREKLERTPNTGRAKNVILFMGDGMSISTLMAARTYQGQLANQPGEEGSLFWETFPYTGLVKTWCIDGQVPDSACTSTAYLGGVKGKLLTLGLNGNAKRGNCSTQIKENHVDSIAQWAQDNGKGTGIVTTTRITHASPAGLYAHAAHRHWETDTDVRKWRYDPKKCHDIATQLIKSSPGKNFKVILGGGRRAFLPNDTRDNEGVEGRRSDGVNLIDEWVSDKSKRKKSHKYIYDRDSLQGINNHPEKYDYVLGLFDSSELPYRLSNSSMNKPTLTEMTEAAINILKKEKNGFFLFVEGGRIDDAHHENRATLAIDETVELAKAVEKATDITSERDTLIVVTADHGHAMTVSGYPRRGNPINGITALNADDGTPYATLTYATGPGYRNETNGSRYDPTTEIYDGTYYTSPALVLMNSAAHGGEDVAIFARGPWAHLFTGTMEQSSIPHFLGYASCIGRKITVTDDRHCQIPLWPRPPNFPSPGVIFNLAIGTARKTVQRVSSKFLNMPIHVRRLLCGDN